VSGAKKEKGDLISPEREAVEGEETDESAVIDERVPGRTANVGRTKRAVTSIEGDEKEYKRRRSQTRLGGVKNNIPPKQGKKRRGEKEQGCALS